MSTPRDAPSAEAVAASSADSPVRSGRRTLGAWCGRVHMTVDCDAPLPEFELAAWLGAPRK